MSRDAVTVRRSSKETDVRVVLRLRGSGRYHGPELDPLVGHLLETLARYSGVDLDVQALGDEGHHLSEDIALAIGRAVRKALPASGIARFGEAMVPMDEALVQVAVDLVDRPYYRTDLPPTSIGEHVLRSLATEARITVHGVTLRPGEAHHVLEATYKAFGLAFARALEPSARGFSLKGQVEWEESP